MVTLRFWWILISSVVIQILVFVLLTIPGLVLTIPAIYFSRPMWSPYTGRLIITAPPWLWLFGNDEDGFDPSWYEEYRPTWPRWFRMWEWAAVRNSVNNLRFVSWFSPPLDPTMTKVATYRNSWIVWQGWRGRIITPGYKWTIGFKYEPTDPMGILTRDIRKHGVGFGFRKT